jgi:hypothetical protein
MVAVSQLRSHHEVRERGDIEEKKRTIRLVTRRTGLSIWPISLCRLRFSELKRHPDRALAVFRPSARGMGDGIFFNLRFVVNGWLFRNQPLTTNHKPQTKQQHSRTPGVLARPLETGEVFGYGMWAQRPRTPDQAVEPPERTRGELNAAGLSSFSPRRKRDQASIVSSSPKPQTNLYPTDIIYDATGGRRRQEED